jgi:hypothetical protein
MSPEASKLFSTQAPFYIPPAVGGSASFPISLPILAFCGFLGFVLMSLGFELRALDLQGRRSHCLSHSSSPFYSGHFEDGGSLKYLPRLASNLNPPNVSFPSS